MKEIVLLAVLGLSVFFDLRERRIPNWLTASGALVGLSLNLFDGFAQFLQGFSGLVVGIGVLIVPFALGWVGAGDVKLVGTVGALLGIQWIPRVLLYSGLMTGVLALLAVGIRGIKVKRFVHLWTDLKLLVISLGRVLPEPISARVSENKTIPWAVGIALGVLVALYLDADGKWAGF
jgi:prepilin peptidase CpaA